MFSGRLSSEDITTQFGIINNAIKLIQQNISGITVQDENTTLNTPAKTLKFVGSGVEATGDGDTKTITIEGADAPGLSKVYFNGEYNGTPQQQTHVTVTQQFDTDVPWRPLTNMSGRMISRENDATNSTIFVGTSPIGNMALFTAPRLGHYKLTAQVTLFLAHHPDPQQSDSYLLDAPRDDPPQHLAYGSFEHIKFLKVRFATPAVTIEGISAGSGSSTAPRDNGAACTIFNKADHGLNNGDFVTFNIDFPGSAVGNTPREIVNPSERLAGRNFIVIAVTNDTFELGDITHGVHFYGDQTSIYSLRFGPNGGSRDGDYFTDRGWDGKLTQWKPIGGGAEGASIGAEERSSQGGTSFAITHSITDQLQRNQIVRAEVRALCIGRNAYIGEATTFSGHNVD